MCINIYLYICKQSLSSGIKVKVQKHRNRYNVSVKGVNNIYVVIIVNRNISSINKWFTFPTTKFNIHSFLIASQPSLCASQNALSPQSTKQRSPFYYYWKNYDKYPLNEVHPLPIAA